MSGVAKAVKQPKDNDKAQRDFRINRTEKQASKVRATERALERLTQVQKPFEPWQLHLESQPRPVVVNSSFASREALYAAAASRSDQLTSRSTGVTD